MKIRAFHSALNICISAALLAGCGALRQAQGDMQPSIGALGVTSQSRASSDDLLYVADGKTDLRVFTYPSGTFVERITSVPKPWGMCSDSSGNIFVLNRHPYQVMEFAHGGTTPIETYNLKAFAQGCSVDPVTNNLAVPQGNSVAIFPDEQEPPQSYTDSAISTFDLCTYDSHGNLFLSAFSGSSQVLVHFTPGSATFTNIDLSEGIHNLYGLQWDGKYLAINSFTGDNPSIYQVQVSGYYGKIVSQTTLGGPIIYGWFSWIQNDRVMAPVGIHYSNIDFWKYPAGGKPINSLKKKDLKRIAPIVGLTVSVAPSR